MNKMKLILTFILCLINLSSTLNANFVEINNSGITDLFENAISTYQKVVAYDYLNHKGIFEAIQLEINQVIKESNKKLVIADLGCGDLKVFSSLYANVPIEQFFAIDASPKSLLEGELNFALAHQSLNKTAPPNRWIVQDLLDWTASSQIEVLITDEIAEEPIKFDVIVSNLAVHHLSDQRKQELLDAISFRLQPGGILLVGDIYRVNNESRDVFLDRLENNVHNYWVLLNEIEKLEILAHVKGNDYPALLDDMITSFNLTDKYETKLLWTDENFSLSSVIKFKRLNN